MLKYIIFKHTEHPLTNSSGELNGLPEDIIYTLKNWQVEFSDKVIIAYDEDRLVGFFRYDIGNKYPWVYDAGTYVVSEYRGQGIGFSLWENVIKIENPNKAFVHIASDDGYKLFKKIKTKYKRIQFNVTLDDKILVA